MTNRKKLITMFEQLLKTCEERQCDTCGHNHLDYPHCQSAYYADHLIANEIIAPPCKVGQTVWVNHEHYKEGMHTYAVQVHKYTYKSTSVTRLWLVGDIINPCYGPSWYYELFSWDDVGTKVFLTKEDAEKALKECRGG